MCVWWFAGFIVNQLYPGLVSNIMSKLPRPGTSIYQNKPETEPRDGHCPSESQALTDLQKGPAEYLHVIVQLLQFFVHVDLKVKQDEPTRGQP